MATNENTGDAGQAAALPVAPHSAPADPLFVPFRWADTGDFTADRTARRLLDLTERVRDLAGGLSVVLGMLERDEIDQSGGDEHGNPLPRFFSNPDRGNLLRMSVAVSDVLRSLADAEVDSIHEDREQAAIRNEGAAP